MDDSLQLPPSLPLLPIVNQVLLPTAFLRVQVSPKALKSIALLEHFSSKSAKELLVAVVPSLLPSDRDGHDSEQKTPRLDKSSSQIGTAARVLQLSRLVQSGDWVVVLEGLCRISLQAVANRPNQPYDTFNIQQLELHKPNSSSSSSSDPVNSSNPLDPANRATGPTSSAAAAAAATAGAPGTAAELGKELKSSTRQLLQLLSGQAGGSAARRLLELLDEVPAWRAADVVAAALARNSQERLAVLLALDHVTRIRLALQLVQQALDAVSAAGPSSSSSSSMGRSSRGGSATNPSSSSSSSKVQRRKGALPAATGLRSGSSSSSSSSGAGTRFADLSDPDHDDDHDDLAVLMARLAAAQPPPEVLRAAAAEAKKLRQGGEMQPGAAAARAYLELLADLPWSTNAAQLHLHQQQQQQQQQEEETTIGSKGPVDGGNAVSSSRRAATAAAAAAAVESPMPLTAAQALLDSQHYGLHKVKTRIIQHLAVSRLRGFGAGAKSNVINNSISSSYNKGKGHAPVLCLIGPPGVGKTSLARSVADVLGVPFGRIALGGVRDEAEIRGHRRTYVGAMPGRLITAVRKARCKDPLLLLDEVDKLGKDHRGDPAAALLEVLDPEQNHAFTDTYLALPFDLSGVTFVCTANRAADIPAPLLDRLEVIELAGYTLNEKVHICQDHLLPDVLSEHGLGPQLVHFPKPTIQYLITAHTREAGVRGLRRALAAVCRHVALNVVLEHESSTAAAAAAAAGVDGSSSSSRDEGLDVAAAAAARAGSSSSSNRRDGHGKRKSFPLHLGGGRMLAAECADSAGASCSADDVAPQQQQQQQQHTNSTSSSSSNLCEPLLQYPDELPCAVVPPGTAVSGSAVHCSSSSSSTPQQYSSSPGVSVTTWSKAGQAAVRVNPQAHAPLKRNAAAAAGGGGGGGGGSGGGGGDGSGGGGTSSTAAAAAAASIPGLSSLTAALLRSIDHHQQQQQMSAALPLSTPRHQHHHQQQQQRQQQQRQVGPAHHPGGAAASSSSIRYDGSDATPPPYPPDLLHQQQARVIVDVALVEAVLGPAKYQGFDDVVAAVSGPGAAAGLVWTAAGGGVQFVECVRVGEGRPGQMGQLTLTGQVGDVLEESARIALSWIRAHAWELGLVQYNTVNNNNSQQQQQESGAVQEDGGVDEDSVSTGVYAVIQPLQLRVPQQLFTSQQQQQQQRWQQRQQQQQQQVPPLKPPGLLAGPSDTNAGAVGDYTTVSGTLSDQLSMSLIRPHNPGPPTLSGTSNLGAPLVTPGPYQSQIITPTPVRCSPGPVVSSSSMLTAGSGRSTISNSNSSSSSGVTCSPALQWDIHVHLPAGAVPKDGPSAGITLAVALVSLLSGRAVRADTAMTGELTLRGLVLPVGGIKEKLLAARAAGLSRALVPARNMRDVQLEAAEATAPEDEDNDGDVILDCNNVTDTQFPKQQQQCGNRRQSRQGLEVVPVAKFEDVLAAAFDPPYVLKKQSRL